jgi:hypothetical protein
VAFLACASGLAETDTPGVQPEAILRQLRHTPSSPVHLEQLRAAIPTMTNAREREVSLAVFGLGCLINEEPEKAQVARDALARQFPASASLDLFKADPLMTPCPRCAGERHAQREFCPACKGGRRCSVCGGKGKLKALSGSAACSACNGGGRCRECEGTGRQKTACGRCGGQGRIYDLDEIRRTSTGLIQQYLHPDGLPQKERPARTGRGPDERREGRSSD